MITFVLWDSKMALSDSPRWCPCLCVVSTLWAWGALVSALSTMEHGKGDRCHFCYIAKWELLFCSQALSTDSLPCWLWWSKLSCGESHVEEIKDDLLSTGSEDWGSHWPARILPMALWTWKWILPQSRFRWDPQPWLASWLQLLRNTEAEDLAKSSPDIWLTEIVD